MYYFVHRCGSLQPRDHVGEDTQERFCGLTWPTRKLCVQEGTIIHLHLESNIPAITINAPPAISLVDAYAQTAANTDSMQRITFDLLADVSLCPCCCNRLTTVPGPTALYIRSNHTNGEEFHPNHYGVSASTHLSNARKDATLAAAAAKRASSLAVEHQEVPIDGPSTALSLTV